MKEWFSNLSKTAKTGLVGAAICALFIGGSVAMQPASNTTAGKETCHASESLTTDSSPISFNKTQVNDPDLDKGTSSVTTTGVNGEKTATYKITSYNPKGCKSDSTVKIKEGVTKQPLAEVTSIGTKVPVVSTPTPAPNGRSPSCSPYYSPCVPDVSYDLNCADIGERVNVHGGDPYRLDADHDGVGCESY